MVIYPPREGMGCLNASSREAMKMLQSAHQMHTHEPRISTEVLVIKDACACWAQSQPPERGNPALHIELAELL